MKLLHAFTAGLFLELAAVYLFFGDYLLMASMLMIVILNIEVYYILNGWDKESRLHEEEIDDFLIKIKLPGDGTRHTNKYHGVSPSKKLARVAKPIRESTDENGRVHGNRESRFTGYIRPKRRNAPWSGSKKSKGKDK